FSGGVVESSSGGRRRGVVAFDVDGVLLRRLFLLRAARDAGVVVWLRTFWLGFQLKVGAIAVEEAVERAYALLSGRAMVDLVATGESLRLTDGAEELCARLREAGYLVALVSAGVPQEVVEGIAARLGAQVGHGVLLERLDGRLTGRLLGERHSSRGKRRSLEKILQRWGAGWYETTVVVDDASNLDIVEAAWRSIAVNPEMSVAKRASFVLHTGTLLELLGFFPEGHATGITPHWLAVRHELFRKGIHVCAVVVPLIAIRSLPLALWLVSSATLLFVLSELFRLLGIALPVFSVVTWRAMRSSEARGVVLGPLLYGVGIWLVLRFFPLPAATAGILTLAVGDAVASIVGRAFGKTPLIHNPGKTFVGSLSLFAVGAIVAMFYVSVPWALAVGLIVSLLESLPLGAFDNLLLPLASAGMVSLAAVVGAV
ncbi:haloacid dehalogenase-like hydrolase, partial [bacterium]|nr:haloacid dehalogenase-like hydrolase [bacterium]